MTSLPPRLPRRNRLRRPPGPRRLEPERLDDLPPSDPRAAHSRRDLARINAVMGHRRILAAGLAARADGSPRRIVELGGGDGTLLLGIGRTLSRRWRGVEVTLVDRHDLVADRTREAFAACAWRLEIVRADALEYLADAPPADAVVANLFIHHLEDPALVRLFRLLTEKSRLFVACEPRRCPAALWGSRLLWALGCNDVTRHDAEVSVRAGFAARELSALWPQAGWRLEEYRAGPFTHVFAASRQRGEPHGS